MKTPRIAPITLPNNPADETALPPAASAIVGDDEAFPVPVLVAAPPGTTVVLTMVDWGIKEVTDPEMKVEKLVLEVVMVLLEPPVETEMGGTTVALVGIPVTEVVDLVFLSVWFNQ